MINAFTLGDIVLIKDGENEGNLCLVDQINGYYREIKVVTLFNEGIFTVDHGIQPIAWVDMDRCEILTKDDE